MINKPVVLKLIVLLCSFQIGCGAYMIDTAQEEIRTSFATGNFEQTARVMQNLEAKNVYASKDAVLFNLEQGSVQHFAGRYAESNSYFETAELQIEDQFSKSITRAIQSFIVNDNSLAYDGEDYEDVYLNIFKALNYIHLQNLEGALVETRRVSYKLGQLNTRYNGLIEALSQADTTKTAPDKWKSGNTNVQNSAMAHYLSTVLYAKTGKIDDSRIAYNNLLKAYGDQANLYSDSPPDERELAQLMQPETYNVMVTVFSGRSPKKVQNDFRMYFEEVDTYLKWSLPSLELFQSQVYGIQISIDDGPSSPIALIENMDLVAKEVYKVKEPIIYARTIVRATLKAIASNKTSNRIAEENETLGQIFNILGKVAQEVTEKADLRAWQTMPGKVHASVLNLSPGEHTVTISYLSRSGRVIQTERKNLVIEPNAPLALIETMYWN